MEFEKAVCVLARFAAGGAYRVATAESCTGGRCAAALTQVAGASGWYAGGVVAYDNAVKTRVLGVAESLLAAHGAVSEEVARAMCAGCRGLVNEGDKLAAVATTGVAGPSGGSDEKPVGMVCFAFCIGDAMHTTTQYFEGEREAIQHAATEYALCMLASLLSQAK